MIMSTETEDIQGVRKASYMCGISVVQCTDRYASGGSALRDRKGSTSRNSRQIAYTNINTSAVKEIALVNAVSSSAATGSTRIGTLVIATELTRQRICSVSDGKANGHAMQWMAPKIVA